MHHGPRHALCPVACLLLGGITAILDGRGPFLAPGPRLRTRCSVPVRGTGDLGLSPSSPWRFIANTGDMLNIRLMAPEHPIRMAL